jgi:hypothetical protein
MYNSHIPSLTENSALVFLLVYGLSNLLKVIFVFVNSTPALISFSFLNIFSNFPFIEHSG